MRFKALYTELIQLAVSVLMDVSLSGFRSIAESVRTVLLLLCDVYVGGKVRVLEFMIFLDWQHC